MSSPATPAILTDLPWELGQWVTPGQVLAKVSRPGRLKAVLKVPETQAKDVAIGQAVDVDTRNGIVKGDVLRIDPVVQNGTVDVDVHLAGAPAARRTAGPERRRHHLDRTAG